MADMMTFPDTVEEFMEQYKIVDTEQIYTNGTELIPIFRMRQWFEHLKPCEDAVSRKAVIDAIDEWKEACAGSGHKETVSDIKLIRKDFIELPPVTPAPIHCKDCKHSHMTSDGKLCKYCDMFELMEMYVDADFFCGYAERRKK